MFSYMLSLLNEAHKIVVKNATIQFTERFLTGNINHGFRRKSSFSPSVVTGSFG